MISYVPKACGEVEEILRSAHLSCAHCPELDDSELDEKALQAAEQLQKFVHGRDFQREVAPIYRSSFEYFQEEEKFLELLENSYRETGNERFLAKARKYELFLFNARNLDFFIQRRTEEIFLQKARQL